MNNIFLYKRFIGVKKINGHSGVNFSFNIKSMLWFNFILGSNFIFLCFKLIIIHYHTKKQRKIKFEPRIKLNHNIYKSLVASTIDNLLKQLLIKPQRGGVWTVCFKCCRWGCFVDIYMYILYVDLKDQNIILSFLTHLRPNTAQ